MKAARAFRWWHRSVPPRVWRQARPVKIFRGTMLVHTRTAAWATELDFMRDMLLASLHQRAPDAGVRSLRFAVGPLPPLPRSVSQEYRPVRALEPSAIPEDIGRELAHIDNDDLRNVIGQAATAALARATHPIEQSRADGRHTAPSTTSTAPPRPLGRRE